MKRLVLLLTPLLLSSPVFAATVSGPFVWTVGSGGNGHAYYAVTGVRSFGGGDGNTWANAKGWAEAGTHTGVPGSLVTLTSQAESDFVETNVATHLNPAGWIGLTDDPAFGGSESNGDPVNGWIWVTGETVSFTNWKAGEPNGGTTENFGAALNTGGWNDAGNGTADGYLMEVVPEPLSLALIAPVLLLLAAKRRRG